MSLARPLMLMEACILDRILMIIGAGVEQIPAYMAAKRRGLIVVGTDANPNAPGFSYSDYKILVSTRDANATEIESKKFNEMHPISGVMTIANDVPYTVARVAKALRLPSISLEAALCVTDKKLMKEKFLKNEVACPWFAEVDSLKDLCAYVSVEPSKIFVLKPVDGRGARGVLLIDSNTKLAWAYSESKRWGDCGRLILEEFIPGLQLSTESFIRQGVCYTAAIAERNYSRLEQFSPNIIEDGGTIPALIDAELKVKIDELILKGARALGIHEGIVKGDIVIDNEGNPLIIELAARLSGGWFATHQIPAATGIDLVEAVISYSLGDEVNPQSLMPVRNNATAIRYWFPPQGRVQSINGELDLQDTLGLLSYGFFRDVGDLQPKIKMHSDRFGYVIVTGENREEAIANVNNALACITIEVMP
jgi:biotin carboxylase